MRFSHEPCKETANQKSLQPKHAMRPLVALWALVTNTLLSLNTGGVLRRFVFFSNDSTLFTRKEAQLMSSLPRLRVHRKHLHPYSWSRTRLQQCLLSSWLDDEMEVCWQTAPKPFQFSPQQRLESQTATTSWHIPDSLLYRWATETIWKTITVGLSAQMYQSSQLLQSTISSIPHPSPSTQPLQNAPTLWWPGCSTTISVQRRSGIPIRPVHHVNPFFLTSTKWVLRRKIKTKFDAHFSPLCPWIENSTSGCD